MFVSDRGQGDDGAADRAGKAAPRLSRGRILDAAIDIIDRQGLQRLTMRSLGSAMGVEAMALYRYVSDRSDLLDGVVDRIVDTMDDDPEVLTSPEHGWQDFVERLARGVRQVALAHPSVFPLLVSQPPQAPWLRPPIRSLRWVEIFLEGLISEGFEDEEAVNAYRAFTSFLLGYLLLEVAMYTEAPVPHHRQELPEALEPFPHLARLQHELAQSKAEEEFEEGLRDVIHRIDLLRS